MSEGLTLPRVVTGWVLAAAGTPLLALALHATRPSGALSLETMLFLALAVLCALAGGRLPAVVASVLGVGLLDFYFTVPRHTLDVAAPRDLVTLAVFLVVSLAVAAVVDDASRRRARALRAEAEASTLASVNRTVLGGRYDVPGLLRLVGEMVGTRPAELLGPDAAVGDGDTAVPASGGRRLVLREHRADPGERRLLAAFASYLGVLEEREELARQTQAARELEAGNRTRTALLAAVSHDLRTPLAGIRSSAETLRRHGDALSATDREDLLVAIEDSTARLSTMVSDLLDLSRLQTGAVEPALVDVPLGEVAARALAGLPGAEQVEAADLPTAYADPALLERVVANLVANALRHGGGARLEGERVGPRVRLRVVDHGPGVPAELRPAMFEPFQRLGDETAASDGVGLGLAVARGLTEAQGGTLSVSDTPGGGLTMTVELRAGS